MECFASYTILRKRRGTESNCRKGQSPTTPPQKVPGVLLLNYPVMVTGAGFGPAPPGFRKMGWAGVEPRIDRVHGPLSLRYQPLMGSEGIEPQSARCPDVS
jgi:hypothetical protein